MKRVETAVSLFTEGYNCSQAVLAAFAPSFGFRTSQALKIATGFGAGMGRSAETCGAISGAIAVLGLRFGTANANDVQAKEKTYGAVRHLLEKFTELNATIVCRELLGLDISDPEEFKVARSNNLQTTLCPKFVQDAAAILVELM